MRSKRTLFRGALLVLLVFANIAFAKAPVGSIGGIPFYNDSVVTKDGVQLALAELQGNEDGDVVLILPGLVETHATFDGLASFFHRQGFKVFVSHNRLVGDSIIRSHGSLSDQNGLFEITEYDTPAIVGHVIERSAIREAFGKRKSKVHLLGHSMGGIQIMALMSHPVFGQLYGPLIDSISLLNAPHHLHYLPLWIRAVARTTLPLVEAVMALGFTEFDLHHRVFLPLQKYGAHPNQLVQFAAKAVDFFIAAAISKLFVDRILVDPRNAQGNETRRLVRKEISVIPLKTLADFGKWALSNESVMKLDPKLIHNRTLVFSATLDRLVPPREQEELVAELVHAEQVRHVEAIAHHVDISISQRMEDLIYPELLKFMTQPQSLEKRSKLVLTPAQCGLVL